jgi:hypothetical protein
MLENVRMWQSDHLTRYSILTTIEYLLFCQYIYVYIRSDSQILKYNGSRGVLGTRQATSGSIPSSPRFDGRASDCETEGRGLFSPDKWPGMAWRVVTCVAFGCVFNRNLL